MISGKVFYRIHTAINLHFNSDYDIIKYHGRVPNIEHRWNVSKNQSLFNVWGENCKDQEEAGNLCVSNQIVAGKNWIYQEHKKAKSIYKIWKKYRDILTESITSDFKSIGELLQKAKTYDNLIQKTKSGKLPPLLQLYLGERIFPDSIVALDSIHNEFLNSWMIEYDKDPLIFDKIRHLVKYKPFVKFDSYKLVPALDDLVLSKEIQGE